MGIFSSTDIFTTEKTNLYLGGDSKLYYPWADGIISFNVNACRAYFLLNGLTAGEFTEEIKAFVLNFNETMDAIESLTSVPVDDMSWYCINGRNLHHMPTAKGIYVHNGKKIIIK